MPNLPSVPDYINDIEVAADAPITEALFKKIGSSLNWALDRFTGFDIFTANDTYVVPTGVTRIMAFGCGAGGGGGGGGSGRPGAGTNPGGCGGGGGACGEFRTDILQVIPADTLTITIGIGGAAGTGGAGGNFVNDGTSGGAGGATIITFASSVKRVTYLGGGGGGLGKAGIPHPYVPGNVVYGGDGGIVFRGQNGLGGQIVYPSRTVNASAGLGDRGGGGGTGALPGVFGSENGQGNGSTAGVGNSNSGSNGGGGGGGGGACTPWAIGGQGGNGMDGTGLNGSAGSAGTYGAGGGGGGGGAGIGTPNNGAGYNGGAGADGFLVFLYF